MHHDYAETPTKRRPGAPPEDDNLRSPTLTFDPSEVSTAYEPAYEPGDYEPPPQQASTNLSPLAPKGVGALFSTPSSKHQQQHKRQQSAPSFLLPRLDNSSRSPSLSPTRRAPHTPHHHHHAKQPSQGDMPLTGDGRSGIGRPPPPPQTTSSAATTPAPTTPGMFANWFNGSSSSTTAAAATTLTVDDRRRSTPGTTPKSSRGGGLGGSDELLPTTPNEVTAISMATTPKSPGGQQSRFGAFASSVSAAFGTRSGTPNNNNLTPLEQEQLDDELCDLDIQAALYPSTTSTATPLTPNGSSDTFSPAAYKNLQTNAAGLLLRMQGAYRTRTAALREARGEVDAQREETEEAHLRVALFRRQLEDMAAKAAEHEAAMLRLATELNAEKQARREERVAAAATREKEREDAAAVLSIHSPPPSEELLNGVDDVDGDVDVEDVNGIEEEDDEEQERRRRWRGSVETMMTDASSTSTSAPESESVSVFSRRSRSPTVMTTITVASSTTASTMTAGGSRMSSDFTASALPSPKALAPPKPKPVQQLSTFQKLVKGMSSGNEQQQQQIGPESCRNCQGQSSSVAWDTVSLLRDENRGLKHRVAQLEVAVEGALDVVSGIGM